MKESGTYVTGHQGTSVPPDQDDGLMREVAVNLWGKEQDTDRGEGQTMG